MAQIKLTQHQYDWLSMNMLKIKRNKKAVLADELSTITEAEIDRMATLFNGHSDELEFALSRKDLRIMQSLLEMATESLTNRILPGYSERIKKADPMGAARYKEYREEARKTLVELDSLLEEVERSL